MSDSFIPFAVPCIGDQEIQEVVHTLKSGWLTTGPKTQQFESMFSQLMKDRHCLAVNSATSAFDLLWSCLEIEYGDLVLTTPHTFSSPIMSFVKRGGRPVWVDVDTTDMNMSIFSLQEKIEHLYSTGMLNKVKAICVTHFAGRAADMDAIWALAGELGIPVIEDAAHALPAYYRPSSEKEHAGLVGAVGKSFATVFSFYATKTITTGEGGMLVTPHEEIALKCRKMRLHGFSRDAYDRYTSDLPKWFYDVGEEGHKCNMIDVCAALGIVQLQRVFKLQKLRYTIASRYISCLDKNKFILPHASATIDTACHLFVIRLKSDNIEIRNNAIEELYEKGVGVSVHFRPVHLHSYYTKRGLGVEGECPNSEKAFRSSISLPIYPSMTERQLCTVTEVVNDLQVV